MRLINTEEAYNTSMDRDVAAEWLYIEAAKEAQHRPGLTTEDFNTDRVLKDITDALGTLDTLANNPNNNGVYRTLRDILWIITDNMA